MGRTIAATLLAQRVIDDMLLLRALPLAERDHLGPMDGRLP